MPALVANETAVRVCVCARAWRGGLGACRCTDIYKALNGVEAGFDGGRQLR